jgi:phytoene dehydrogenase-like protein
MPSSPKSAFVAGSGPNGLTAAIELAKAGYATTIIEAREEIGGGIHSAELTLPGFIHDVCSAIHPLALSSPAFQSYPLEQHGLEWIQPPIPLAHPLDNGVAVLDRSIERTAAGLGGAPNYRTTASTLLREWPKLVPAFLRPMYPPRNPLLMARFGVHAMLPAAWEARKMFSDERGRALFAGIAAHSNLPLTAATSAAYGWVLGVAAHAVGWPIPKGGAQSIANALASYFRSLGGSIVTGHRVRSLAEFGPDSLVLCDVGVEEFQRIAGEALPKAFKNDLAAYRPGPAAFKIDWALRGPIPWRYPECRFAGTVHLGGTLEEITASEAAVWKGRTHAHPFVLFAQQSLFDASRAPGEAQIGWAYCHVPNGSREDMTERIEAQVERFAPGFRRLILARHVFTPDGLERFNPNFTGGDILGGAQTPLQLLFRPTRRHYRTPLENVYLCSACTPPGGGVHGMCGYHAVRAAIADHGGWA